MSPFRTRKRRDGSTYRYPIVPSKGGRVGRSVLRHKPPLKILRTGRQVRVGEPLLRKALSLVLHHAPVVRELYTAWIVADSIYSNWELVKELYKAYKKNSWVGIVDSKATHRATASIQTNILWQAIRKVIPERFHKWSMRVLSDVVGKITRKEIEYVKNFLQENE